MLTYGALCALAEKHGVVVTENMRAFVRAVEEEDRRTQERQAKSAGAGKPHLSLNDAMRDVFIERVRQQLEEGWTPAHDDAHTQMEMADAAAVYALNASGWDKSAEKFWPWSLAWWKPSTPRRNLVKAGALILAEIERIDRAGATNPAGARP